MLFIFRFSMDIDSLRTELKNNGQEHLLNHWEGLSEDEQGALYAELKTFNYAEINKYFKQVRDD